MTESDRVASSSGSALALRPFPFHGDGVTAIVTTRHGGVSTGVYASLNLGDHVGDAPEAVRENRRRLAVALGVDRLTVTDLPWVALATIVADCAPVVLFDPARRVAGVAHCGRQGAVLGVLPRTVETMCGRFGCRAEDLFVGIGPAIGADSYEIGDAEAARVAAVFGAVGAPGLLRPTRPGHATFDLVAALRVQLRDAGIEDRNVHAMGVDTRASTEDFFSDRAARPCGRFMAVTVLTR